MRHTVRSKTRYAVVLLGVATWLVAQIAAGQAAQKSAREAEREPAAGDSEPERPAATGQHEGPARKTAGAGLAPRCETDDLRLVGAVAVDAGPAFSYALIRIKSGTAMLSPGQHIGGHRLLAVGLQQVLMRAPDGARCRLVMYHALGVTKAKRRRRSRRRKRSRRRRRKR